MELIGVSLAALFIPFSSLFAPFAGVQTVFAQQPIQGGLDDIFRCEPRPGSETGDFKAPLNANGGTVLSAPMQKEDNKRVLTIDCWNKDDTTLRSSASVQVFVILQKPVVELYISRVGEPCFILKLKTRTIFKGQPATLCWSVTGELLTDY